MTTKLQSFEQLDAWEAAQNLAVDIYELTQKFPDEERFGLTNQMRRAAASISANIAEGFGRASTKEKLQFYSIAYGSLLEVKNFLYLAQRVKYIEEGVLSELLKSVVSCQKLINGLLKSTRVTNE